MSACLGVNASSCAEPRHAYHGFSSAQLMQVRVNAAFVTLILFMLSKAICSILPANKFPPCLLEMKATAAVFPRLRVNLAISTGQCSLARPVVRGAAPPFLHSTVYMLKSIRTRSEPII